MDTNENKQSQNSIAELVTSYQISPQAIELVQSTPIVILVGISGAGKDTIKKQLLASDAYHHIVSHTTRSPRENGGVLEQNGVDYHFISLEESARMLRAGEYIEAKKYGDNVYGTSAEEIRIAGESGKIPMTDIEVQGVAEYKDISSNVIAIFILPPSFTEWQRRLQSRYGDSGFDPLDMAKRMATAILELEEALDKPYYHFVINDDLQKAVETCNKIAHNHDEFNIKDKSAYAQAEQLLMDLRASLKV